MDYPHHRPGEVQLRWLRAQLAALERRQAALLIDTYRCERLRSMLL